jgi:hypothetical protein
MRRASFCSLRLRTQAHLYALAFVLSPKLLDSTSFLFSVSSLETLFPDAINVLYNTTRQFDCAHGVSDDGCDCSINHLKSA